LLETLVVEVIERAGGDESGALQAGGRGFESPHVHHFYLVKLMFLAIGRAACLFGFTCVVPLAGHLAGPFWRSPLRFWGPWQVPKRCIELHTAQQGQEVRRPRLILSAIDVPGARCRSAMASPPPRFMI
jgi:hypothetical protein